MNSVTIPLTNNAQKPNRLNSLRITSFLLTSMHDNQPVDTLLLWMLDRSSEGLYTSLCGNRQRYMDKYGKTMYEYRKGVERLVDKGLIEKVGAGMNGNNVVYQINKYLVKVWEMGEDKIEVILRF